MTAKTSLPPATVIIPIHSESRWPIFLEAMAAIRRQQPRPAAIVVAVDHNPALLSRVISRFPGVHTVENAFARGASGTRNSGALVATTPILVFVDSDIVVGDGWLRPLLEPLAQPTVVGSGGFVVPRWPASAPRWFPDEFGWVVGVSHKGLPAVASPIRNVWSCNMAVRRSAFNSVDGFRVDYSKVGDTPKSEDTDFCVRVSKASTDGKWIFVPEAVVEHEIGSERSRFTFFVRRCYVEGKGKIELAHLNAGRRELAVESNYIRRTAPAGAGRYVRLAVRDRDPNYIRKSGAIFAGIGAAGVGALVAEGKHLLHRCRQSWVLASNLRE
jgi:glucosyl-dolichyl phosphate glucuronosyltransferase